MDDRFLHAAREHPRPEFTAALKHRLVAGDTRHARSFPGRRVLRRAFGILVPAAAAIAALALFPDVRAGAQAFLELFRVRNFVAVNVDPSRIEALQKGAPDPRRLFGEVRVLHEAAAPQQFATPGQAFAAAGFAGAEPTVLPDGIAADSAVVRDGQEVEITLDARRLADLLASLDIRDAGIPPAFDGARVHVRMAPRVGIRYRKDALEAALMQSPTPELSLPPGLERARLAEIGLRVIGLSAVEARRLADRVDWNTTMLVPLPTGRTTFREVEVRGQRGLLVEAVGDGNRREGARKGPPGRIVLWSNGERMFALKGNLSEFSMLEMANSVP